MAKKHKLKIQIRGIDTLPSFEFDHKLDNKIQVIFVNEMLKYKILAFRQFRPSLLIKKHLLKYEKALDKVFEKFQN